MTELERYLDSYFGVPRESLAAISACFQPTELYKGSYFLKEGRICDKLSFQRSGFVRMYNTVGGKEVTQWISTQGYFLTDLAGMMFHKPSKWNIQALTDCELYTISLEDYNRIGHLVPQWHHLEKLFIARCALQMEDRIFSLISLNAEERYQKLLAQAPDLFNYVPLQYLASMIGMTPETLSRLRKKAIS